MRDSHKHSYSYHYGNGVCADCGDIAPSNMPIPTERVRQQRDALLAAAEAALADLQGAFARGDLGDEGPDYEAAKLTVAELEAAIRKAKS